MIKNIKFLFLFGMFFGVLGFKTAFAGEKYFLVGYTTSDAQATTSYGAFTKFDTATSLTVGFSMEFYEDFSFGVIADVNEGMQELDDFVMTFGTENTRFRILKNHVTGTRNGVAFDYKESNIIWYQRPENNREKSWGLIYGNYTTLGQHDTYEPATGSSFIPVEVSYLGYVVLGEMIDTNKKGWGAEGQTGFVLTQYKPDVSTGVSNSNGLGVYIDTRMGYFANFPGVQSGGKSVLFAGLNMNMMMDFTSEYSLPFSVGPSVQFTTKW